MMMRARDLSVAFFACAALAAPAVGSDAGEVQTELDRVADLYRALTAYHVLLDESGASEQTVQAALYDVERYVVELDERLATNELFIDDQSALDSIRQIVAKAHMQASLLHAKGVDLEASIDHYESVVDMLGYDPSEWGELVERSGRLGLLEGAGEMIFDLAEPSRVIADLETFWSAGVVLRVQVQEYTAAQREGLRLARVGGRKDGFSEAAFRVAASRFAERVREGLDQFRVVLPPGTYEIGGENDALRTRQLVLLGGGVPDPVILNPNSFSFAFSSENGTCMPVLSLNGIPVRETAGLPFGTYRVSAAPECPRRMPDRITVEQKSEVTLRTEPERLDLIKEGQPIFLFVTTPPDSTYTLRM